MDKTSYCKRHPSHKQSKGVCPYCLRERLSYISTSSSSSTTTTAATNTTNFSDSSTSSSSPYSLDSKPLKKSRSLAFVTAEEEDEKEKKDKKRRFWTRLMGRRKEEGGVFGLLHHSKTVKEKVSNRWVVFS